MRHDMNARDNLSRQVSQHDLRRMRVWLLLAWGTYEQGLGMFYWEIFRTWRDQNVLLTSIERNRHTPIKRFVKQILQRKDPKENVKGHAVIVKRL